MSFTVFMNLLLQIPQYQTFLKLVTLKVFVKVRKMDYGGRFDRIDKNDALSVTADMLSFKSVSTSN